MTQTSTRCPAQAQNQPPRATGQREAGHSLRIVRDTDAVMTGEEMKALGLRERPPRPRRSPNDPDVQAALSRVSAVLWRGFMAVHGDDATRPPG